MNLKSTIPIAVLLLCVLATPVAGTQMQPEPTTSTATTSTSGGERIDSELVLVSTDLDGDSVTLVFEADSAKAITLSDAGGFVEGGVIHQRTLVLEPGRNTVEFTVSQTRNGYAGVSIGTKDVLYAVPLRSETTLIGGPFSSSDVYLAGGSGLVAGLGVTALIAYRKKNSTGGKPERLV